MYASLPRLAEDENVPSTRDIDIAIISSAENRGDDDNRHAPHRDNTAISIYRASLVGEISGPGQESTARAHPASSKHA